ncbi:MAG: Nif3-like dinuclear metal center hexameric protein [bacterium]
MKDSAFTVRDLSEILGMLIPRAWAAPGETVGLQVGDQDLQVKRLWPVRWVSQEMIRQAVRRKVDVLITYHPLPGVIAANQGDASPATSLLRSLFRTDLAVYCVGSSIDPHPHGPSRFLAERLSLTKIHPALPKPQSAQVKMVTFVPCNHTDAVRTAMAKAGAGRIGEYEICSFRLSGEGSFRGSERTNPFIGEAGKLEFAEEDRLEIVCPVEIIPDVVKALWNAHPYEEPAYDIYSLSDMRDPRQALWIGETEKPVSWDDFKKRVVTAFPESPTPERIGPDRGRKKIRRVACTATDGSGIASHLADCKVDAFVCQGINNEGAWELSERGISCLSLSRCILEDLFPTAIRHILQPWGKRMKIL